jgi:hypothetical protein
MTPSGGHRETTLLTVYWAAVRGFWVISILNSVFSESSISERKPGCLFNDKLVAIALQKSNGIESIDDVIGLALAAQQRMYSQM